MHRKVALDLCTNFDTILLPSFETSMMVKKRDHNGNWKRKINSKTARGIATPVKWPTALYDCEFFSSSSSFSLIQLCSDYAITTSGAPSPLKPSWQGVSSPLSARPTHPRPALDAGIFTRASGAKKLSGTPHFSCWPQWTCTFQPNQNNIFGKTKRPGSKSTLHPSSLHPSSPPLLFSSSPSVLVTTGAPSAAW